ncbi:ABC transporter substrate-binding protein [Leptolyngbya ectocarpi]|nr:ABC transporter substrate-binding protein [Leptolyngbya ectocarpi]
MIPGLRPQPLTMQLDWRLNAQFAGLCVAQARNYYQRQGLTVTLNPAPPDLDVVQTVVSQPHTLGCAEESLILAAQSRGVEVVAIAAMLQASPLSLMSLPNGGLHDLSQLIGKRIGVHSDGQKALELVLSLHNIAPARVNTIEIPYQNKYQRLIDGEFDAVQCYALDEPIRFAQRIGQAPVLLTFSDYGFDAYSQVIFAPVQLVHEQPEVIHRFLTATFAGWRWAINHPSSTAQLLIDRYVEPDYQDMTYQVESLKMIATYMQCDRQRLGVLDQTRWQRSAQQLAQAGLIDAMPDTSVDLNLWP